MNHKSLYILFIALLAGYASDAQKPRTISGLVTLEEDGSSLEGVVVVARGSGMISGSQLDGMYYIPVTDKDTVLVFSREDLAPVVVRLTDACYYCVKLHQKPAERIIDLSIKPITIILSKNEYLHHESKDQQRRSGGL